MEYREKIRKIFEPWQRELCPGGQVYVMDKGELVFSECFGYADIEHDVKVDEDTIFHVASVSKQVTCMAVLILHERGELDIDKDIREYIPDLVSFDEAVTLRDMMNNISGIRDQWELQMISGVRLADNITQSDLLNLNARQKSLNFAPRSKFLYSNSNFTFLSEIVKRVSGMDLNEFSTKNIFEPLGMSRTFFRTRYDQIVPNRAMSYVDCWNGTYLWKSLNFSNEGATSLHTTATDLLKLAAHYRNPVVCTKETLGTMLKVPKLTDESESTTYACGVFVDGYMGYQCEGHRLIGHGGADAGYRAMFLTLPEDEIDIIILSNVENILPDNAAFKIANIILGRDEGGLSFDEKLYCEERGNIDSLTGEYVINGALSAKLEKEDAKLYFAMGDKKAAIKHIKGNCYDITNSPYKLYIVEDEIHVALSPMMTVKLGKLSEPDFTSKELNEIQGIYFSRETESYFEILTKGGKPAMRQKRLGKAPIMSVGDGMYVCQLDYPINFRFVKDDSGRVSALNIIGGRVTGIEFRKGQFEEA